MQHVDVREFKAHIAEYVRQVEAGESVTVTRGGKPVLRVVNAQARKRTSHHPKKPTRSEKKLTGKAWLRWAVRKGIIIPGDESVPLPRYSKSLERAGRLALAALLRMRNEEW